MIRYAIVLGSFAFSACSTTSRSGGIDSATLESPPPSAAVSYSVASASGPDDLARLAVLHHPSLKAARHRAERLEQKAPQVRSLPDPMIEVAAGSMAETAAGRVDAMGA